jgi:beta-glucosidase
MSNATFNFPRGFLWGTATAAYQVEGNNTNSAWWAWEQQPGRILQEHKSGLACDWWNGRWREDFDRAAETYQNAHRLSIEWSRIQPAPDRWDEQALDRYREMLRGLKERNITPLVTLHHFSDPLWLAEQGGWEKADTAAAFEKFVRKAVEALKEYTTLWCTINEPNVFITAAYGSHEFPPGKNNLFTAFRVAVNLVRGHAAAYHAIKAIQPQARVGIALNYRSFAPASPGSPFDRGAARRLSANYNDMFPRALQDGVVRTLLGSTRVPQAKNTQDYLGVNYYSRDQVAFNLFNPGQLFSRRFYRPGVELSATGFLANEPEGLFEALKWGRQFDVPMFVTENGVEDPTDELRPSYTVQHIHQMWRAINYNWPVKGYFHWSLVDNFEWERGWTQRFGLWGLDPETQARIRRPSVDLYAEICRTNSLSSEIVARYAPAAFAKLFPN